MMRTRHVSCVVALALILFSPVASGQVQIHVSPTGNNQAAGDVRAPLASLQGARDHVRTLRSKGEQGPYEIVVHAGTYYQAPTLTLEKADSGTPQAPLVIRHAGPGEARFVGGNKIDSLDAISDRSVLARLPAPARPHVKQIDLKALGVSEAGMPGHRHARALILFVFNGMPLDLAQWPNVGWGSVTGPAKDATATSFTYSGSRPDGWTLTKDIWVHGYFSHTWSDAYVRVSGIDAPSKTITLENSPRYGVKKGGRWRVLNALEELDQPGEWVLDRESLKAYLWPPSGLTSGELLVATSEDPFVVATSAHDVVFENLTFEGCRNDGLVLRDCDRVVVRRCIFRNMNGMGISVSGGHACRIERCEIGHIGHGGISLSGGDRNALLPSRHEATSNDIHHYARVKRTYQPAIRLSGVGQHASHNHIHHTPHAGIIFSQNDHVIEFNDIHHALLETSDAGAIYTGRDWAGRGTVVRHNFIHHNGPTYATTPSTPPPPGVTYQFDKSDDANMVYCDDLASGTTIVGNILHGGRRAVHIGGGRDNHVVNNVFLDADIGVWIDQRGLGWARKLASPKGAWGIYTKLEQLPYRSPPWSTRYPELATMLTDNPQAARGNRVANNIFIDTKTWLKIDKGLDVQQRQNVHGLTIAKPDLLDRVRSIPADKLQEAGFRPIPIEQIGPCP